MISLFFNGVIDISESTLSTVLPVEMRGHEDASSALLSRALATKTVNLAVIVDPVVLQHGELNFLMLVLDLLGGGVVLLLALLATTAETEHQVKGRFCKNEFVNTRSSTKRKYACNP